MASQVDTYKMLLHKVLESQATISVVSLPRLVLSWQNYRAYGTAEQTVPPCSCGWEDNSPCKSSPLIQQRTESMQLSAQTWLEQESACCSRRLYQEPFPQTEMQECLLEAGNTAAQCAAHAGLRGIQDLGCSFIHWCEMVIVVPVEDWIDRYAKSVSQGHRTGSMVWLLLFLSLFLIQNKTVSFIIWSLPETILSANT